MFRYQDKRLILKAVIPDPFVEILFKVFKGHSSVVFNPLTDHYSACYLLELLAGFKSPVGGLHTLI